MSDIKVIIADDQELVRTGFKMIIDAQPDMTAVGEASDGAALLELLRTVSADVVLMDIRMPGMDGIAATQHATALYPDTRVVILTTFDLDENVYAGLRAGASGFLLKDAPSPELLHAIRVVHHGDAVVGPTITRRLIDRYISDTPAVSSNGCDDLTAREHEVLLTMARGLSNAEIGHELNLSEATVKSHVGHILAKLGLRDRVQAVVYAYEHGLIQPGQEPTGKSDL